MIMSTDLSSALRPGGRPPVRKNRWIRLVIYSALLAVTIAVVFVVLVLVLLVIPSAGAAGGCGGG
jgi:hypothetical protein